jgi:hypothetical protein
VVCKYIIRTYNFHSDFLRFILYLTSFSQNQFVYVFHLCMEDYDPQYINIDEDGWKRAKIEFRYVDMMYRSSLVLSYFPYAMSKLIVVCPAGALCLQSCFVILGHEQAYSSVSSRHRLPTLLSIWSLLQRISWAVAIFERFHGDEDSGSPQDSDVLGHLFCCIVRTVSYSVSCFNAGPLNLFGMPTFKSKVYRKWIKRWSWGWEVIWCGFG